MGLPVAAATLSVSAMTAALPVKSPVHGSDAQLGRVERQLGERASVTDQLDLSRGDQVARRAASGASDRTRWSSPRELMPSLVKTLRR